LVATLILMILVLLTGAVFRAGASAWETGYAKAEGGTVVRAVAGTIQRELSRAVDGRYFGVMNQVNPDGTIVQIKYGDAWPYQDPVHVTPTSVEFIYYRDSLSQAASSEKPGPVYVKYWMVPGDSLKRHEAVLEKDADGCWREPIFPVGDEITVIRFEDEIKSGDARRTDIEFLANKSDDTRKEFELQNVPWRIISVSVRVTIYRGQDMTSIVVRSLGPDGIADTPDDIEVAWLW